VAAAIGLVSAYLCIDSIQIHYRVLGFPHVQDVHLNTLFAVKSPDAWPRSGPARPSA
jgi:hypothetical protein